MAPTYQFKNTQDILTYFESIVDDAPDQVTELSFANQAKDLVEDDRNWAWLFGEDTSQSVNSGDNYLTMKTLPVDFRRPLDSGIYVGSDILPYLLMPFQDRRNFMDNAAHRYYIDYANNQFGISGKPQAGQIYFPYIKQSNALDLTANNPLWPNRFWNIIACKMAMLWYAYDQGIKGRAWDDRWQLEYEAGLGAMTRDDEMKIRSGLANRTNWSAQGRSYPLVLDL